MDVRLLMPHEKGAELSALYASGAPITEREDGEAGVLVSARLPRELLARYDTTGWTSDRGAGVPAAASRCARPRAGL